MKLTRDKTNANKTDAGNGSKTICRFSNVLRSPSPDSSRSSKNFPMSNAADVYNRSMEFLGYWGDPRDEARAFNLNREAAQLGHNEAILAMGYFYLNGQGVEKNLELAEYWYKKAARGGDPRAMFSLGWMAYDALAYKHANRWFHRAVHHGHIRSIYWLGKLAWRGHGVPQSHSEAFALFHRASHAHDPEAIRVLGFLSRRKPKKTKKPAHTTAGNAPV